MLGQRVRYPLSLLHRGPVETDSDRAASSLLFRLEQKKQERWEEAVNSIDFSHSSCNVWSIINKLTVRSGRSSRLCPVSGNSTASQLLQNGAQKTGAASPSGSPIRSCPTYGRFQHLRVTVSLNTSGRKICLLPSDGWSQESVRVWIPPSRSLYSTPGRLSNLGSATSCMRQLKIPKIWRRALIVAIPKPEKPLRDPKGYCPISLLCVPLKSTKDSSTLVSNQLSIHCCHRSNRAFDTGDRP